MEQGKMFNCIRCEDSGRLARYGRKEDGEPHIVTSYCDCIEGKKQLRNDVSE